MKVVFKVIKAGSGSDIYFERLSRALKKINIDSEIEYYPRYFQFFPWLLKFIKKKTNADIVHSNVEYGWVFKDSDKPLVVTLHHNVFDPEYRAYTSFTQKLFHNLVIKPNIKISLKIADKKIAVSNYTKESFIRTFGEQDIKVIYNFIDTEKFRPIKIANNDTRFKLLFIGNITKRKGADLLPEIMSKLGNDYVLYYSSGLRTKKFSQIKVKNMHPLGRLSERDLIMEYNKCDVLLLPSRLEGFGYAAVEAMACEKPVITFNNSSFPEIIKSFPLQYLNMDIYGVIALIKKMKKDNMLRLSIGKNNRKDVINNFHQHKLVKEYYKVYKFN